MDDSIRILVVDDEADIRRIIRILLESRGYRVLEAPNGRLAVETIRKEPDVDLILLCLLYTKPFSHGELLMKVDSLLRRYRVYKGKVTGKQLKSDVVLDEENRRILRGGEALELTETEYSILQFLADHRGSVVSVAQIYEGVWHEKYMPASNNTVMVHIVNLRKKLEDDPANPRLIRTIWGKGYQID